MLNRSASLAMSTSVLKALPGKLDIKRHSPSILYIHQCDGGKSKSVQRITIWHHTLAKRWQKVILRDRFYIVLNQKMCIMFSRFTTLLIKQCRSRSAGFIRSQLIRIYTFSSTGLPGNQKVTEYSVCTDLKSTWIYRTVLKSPWKLNLPWKTLKCLEKSLNFTITWEFNSVFGDLIQYKKK